MRAGLLALALAGAAIAPAAAQAPAPTAAELVAGNLKARGGAEAFAALKNVSFDGKLIFPGDFQLTYKEVRAEGGAVRVDAALQGLALVQAFDGKAAWRINPFEGRKDAERMTDDEARSLADTGSIRGPLQSAAGDGSSITYLGREDFDGTDTYKLKVVQKDGDEFVYLLDPDSMLEVKMIETRRLRGALQVTEYEYGDYEKVGGVYFAMSVESGPQGSSQRQRTIIAAGTANGDAPAGLFAQPASPAAAK
ncbi:hypothetical protein IP88_01295 [alpha proteobacterium AAP81b]|nr:hypothetical protein IP88_01295 [alpha proteobacterium AAP81b]